MRVLDLFSGIGGFSLGLERAGMTTVAFCEIEPFCRAVLAKHWPGVPCYDDIRTLTAERLAADGISVDVIAGGFPCQDISIAGKGAGLAGERSGLWREYHRIIGEIRPAWCVIENVTALRTRGLDEVLGGIAALGYNAEWHCIPASAIGAPHRRDRVWIIAHPRCSGGRRIESERGADWRNTDIGGDGAGEQVAAGVAYATVGGWRVDRHECGQVGDASAGQFAVGGKTLADAGGEGLPAPEQPERREPLITSADIGDAITQCSWGRAQPGLGGKIDGVSGDVDRNRPVEPWEGNTPRTVGRGFPNRRPRLKAIGNSVVPQIPELIGRAILRAVATHEVAA